MPNLSAEEIEQVSYYLCNIFRRLDRDMAFLLSKEGLTFAQMLVLRYIRDRGGTTLAELTEELHWSASTLSGIIKRLERDGYIKRQSDPADLRVYRLKITNKAYHILEKTCCIYNDHLTSIASHFQTEEFSLLLLSLQKLWHAVQQEQPCRNQEGDL